MELAAEDFDTKWPYLDNLFMLNKTQQAKDRTVTRYWLCCLHTNKLYKIKVPLAKRQQNCIVSIQNSYPYIVKLVH